MTCPPARPRAHAPAVADTWQAAGTALPQLHPPLSAAGARSRIELQLEHAHAHARVGHRRPQQLRAPLPCTRGFVRGHYRPAPLHAFVLAKTPDGCKVDARQAGPAAAVGCVGLAQQGAALGQAEAPAAPCLGLVHRGGAGEQAEAKLGRPEWAAIGTNGANTSVGRCSPEISWPAAAPDHSMCRMRASPPHPSHPLAHLFTAAAAARPRRTSGSA